MIYSGVCRLRLIPDLLSLTQARIFSLIPWIPFRGSGQIAWLFYHYYIFPMLPKLIPFIFNLALFALTIGIAVTGLIFRYTTKFQAMAWSFAGILMPLSCVFYPLSSLPSFLRPLALYSPLPTLSKVCVKPLREEGFSASHFKSGVELNAIYFVLAIGLFHWMFEAARSRGLGENGVTKALNSAAPSPIRKFVRA
jgi:ABC-type polysaccharide/polyol phosphate export permease